MPQKKKSSLGRKSAGAKREKKRRDNEDSLQTQTRREMNRIATAQSRELETNEEKEERSSLKRTRERQRIKEMKKYDKQMQKQPSTVSEV